MAMIQHDLEQGSGEWLAYRKSSFNASDAPAMMGESPYKTRAQLLHELHTGITPEVDYATQQRFDEGHRFEALARTLAEEIIGEELYPVVGSNGKLSASFDGLTMSESINFEHKTLNNLVKQASSIDELPLMYAIQMEQQMFVSGAEKTLFMASKWDEAGEIIEEKHFWYFPNPDLCQQVIDGWEQFEYDLSIYAPVQIVEPPKAEVIKDLPAVTVHVVGELTTCNLNDVRPHFDRFLSEAITTMETDDDFAQAEAEAKLGRETAKRCKLTAKAVVDQMLSISEVTRTLEEYAAKFDTLALRQEKAVKEQKEARKAAAKMQRDRAYIEHIEKINAEIAPVFLVLSQQDKPDFVAAMKNQRTLESLYNKLDTELARAKIAADSAAKLVKMNLNLINGQYYKFLFSDIQQIVYKPFDDLKLLIESRIDAHQKAEAAKLEAERERLERENQEMLDYAKAEAERKSVESEKTEEPVRNAAGRTFEESKAMFGEVTLADVDIAMDKHFKDARSAKDSLDLSKDQLLVFIDTLIECGLKNTPCYFNTIQQLNMQSESGIEGYLIKAALCSSISEIADMLNNMPVEFKPTMKPILSEKQNMIKAQQASA